METVPDTGMITCSCNVITRQEIEETILELLAVDEWRLIVPAQVYHVMGKRGKCCQCFPNVVGIIVSVTETYHRSRQTPDADIIDLVSRLKERHLQWQALQIEQLLKKRSA